MEGCRLGKDNIITSKRFEIMGGSPLLSSCSDNVDRGVGAPFDYEDLASMVRNVSFPIFMEPNILEDTKEIPFFTYLQNTAGIREEKKTLLDLRSSITAYSGIMTEYAFYNYSLPIVPKILST